MNEPCPYCGAVERKSRWLRLPHFSRRSKIVATVFTLLYCGLWGLTHFVGTEHVKQTLGDQGSTVGQYAYSPLPFVVCVDETYYQPLAQQMQRADMRYAWAFGSVTELGASYVSSPEDSHFSTF